MNIGDWVQRMTAGETARLTEPHGKIHVVESIVDGDAMTNCGNRMERETKEGRLTVQGEPLVTDEVCEPCLNGAIFKPELTGTRAVRELPEEPAANEGESNAQG